MVKTVAIAQARMGSTRAPGKVMRDLGGIPVLQWTINALRDASGIDEIVLATSLLPADDLIESYANNHRITCFRGSETDVLDRFYQCAKLLGADIVLRLTCDCPFLDPLVISEVIKLREMTGADYATNTDPPTWPDGLDVECFTFTSLEAAHRESVRAIDRDCVTEFIRRNRSRFPAANLACPLPGMHKERWVLDTEDDYKFCKELESRISGMNTSYLEILNILDKEPHLRDINRSIRNERYYEGLANEQLPPRTFERSQRVFQRAIQTIPFGAQTFSKSYLQFPTGHAPLYVSHGDGARIFDVDGNDYVDLVNGLLPVILGYRDHDVDAAIRHQLDSGISFSLATVLEGELAELLRKHIPCAEMVKFGKTGTDVTTAAIRLARAYTGRDHVLVGGYHGWADWSMSCTDRSLGIPDDIKRLSVKIKFGDKTDPTLNIHNWYGEHKKIAAIIVEPNDDPDYLEWLRDYCTKYGIVLIFDEIITGFRYDMGGAQSLFGVTPDLATFGKSMANGMPISALVGRKDIMKRMQPPDNIFYSGTFFGETLSIAAAIATIKKMEECNVIGHLHAIGVQLEYDLLKLKKKYHLDGVIDVTGYYTMLKIEFKGEFKDKIRTLFMREMIQNGVLIIASNNLSYAHKEPEMKRIRTAYDNTFAAIAQALDDNSIHSIPTAQAIPLRQTA